VKLEGSLDAFSLPDIFQLLSYTKKSGGLHLANDGRDGVVFFSGGQVTGASADSSRQPLARRLIGAGAVDDDALQAAVDRARSGDGVGVVKALLEQGALDSGLLQQAVTDQAVDAVFDLLRWTNGDFAFVVDEGNPDDVGVTLAVETVVADAEARREGWQSVSEVVPSSETVLAMPLLPPGDPQVSREEWSLLALVDGRRTVVELVDLTGSGQYAVVSALASLVSRGLLEVRDGSEPDHVGVVLRRQEVLATVEDAPFVPVAPSARAEQPVVEASTDEASEVDGPHTPDAEPVAVPEQGGHEVGPAAAPDPAPDPAPDQVADAAGEDEEASGEPERVSASADPEQPAMLGGAHVPGDVVPPRAEPFLPRRQADFAEDAAPSGTRPVPVPAGMPSPVGEVVGATAVAADPAAALIERDPSVNRSLMLRLIAGVRGL
jgi:Domain of unknown function (DUF4388)